MLIIKISNKHSIQKQLTHTTTKREKKIFSVSFTLSYIFSIAISLTYKSHYTSQELAEMTDIGA
jgi:hypothetical protein